MNAKRKREYKNAGLIGCNANEPDDDDSCESENLKVAKSVSSSGTRPDESKKELYGIPIGI